MDIKQLIEKMDQFAGQAVGQKPGDQFKGSDTAPPGKKLVGDSMLKDLHKGKTPKSKEQELAEEFQAFLEAEFKDTVDKRPGRKGARHSRGHEPKPRYKTVKADEGRVKEKDIELQDYRSMSHKEFQTAYGMTKTEWINKNKALVIQNPSIKKGLGLEEGVPYKTTNPHPASKDPIVATVVKQMRPGLTGLNMGNEAFLYFAYELGKQRARDAWEYYLPAIRDAYEQGLNEDKQEDGSVEARWMVKVSDDEGDHLKTYHRKFPSLSAAKKAYKKYEPYASDFKYKPVKKDQVEEAVDSDIVQAMGQDSFNRAGFNPLRDERDYLDKLSYLSNLARKRGMNKEMQDHITQRILDLNREARTKGFTQVESRGHKIIATKLKDVERAKKFASGELKIPTPQERQAQLNKLETEPKQVKEYGATTTGSPTSTSTDDMKKAMTATSALKSATGTAQSAPALMKAMDTISQGKPASSTDMMTAQNTLQDINTAFKEPELANALKPILAKANQLQQKK
jgi:hypothetical protein